MKIATLTLTNRFHNTQASVRVRLSDVEAGRVRLSEGQVRRAWRKLCGMQSCRCGTSPASGDGGADDPMGRGRFIPDPTDPQDSGLVLVLERAE